MYLRQKDENVRSAHVRIKIYIISYAKRVAAETETEEIAQCPQEKDRMKQTISKSKSKKGKEEKKNKGERLS